MKQPHLPIKQGVSPSCLYLKKGHWETVFDFFCHSFPHISSEECQLRFSKGEVIFENGEVIHINTPFIRDVKVFYYREVSNEVKVPFKEKILFENDRFLVVDKPHFLPVAPSGEYLHETLIVRLRKQLKLDELELCHRLDRETAGLVLLTKKKKFRAPYHQLFSDRKITKIYHAISNPPLITLKFPLVKRSHIVKSEPFFLMREDLNDSILSSEMSVNTSGKSETKIELLKINGDKALYQLTPKTGKKHQLRIHMSSIGLPIKNDVFYPKLNHKESSDFSKPLQLLAKSLHFRDPYDNKDYDFYSQFDLSL